MKPPFPLLLTPSPSPRKIECPTLRLKDVAFLAITDSVNITRVFLTKPGGDYNMAREPCTVA